MSETDRRFAIGLVAIGAVALVARVLFVVVVDPTVPPMGDASTYHLLAQNLADGQGYIRPFDSAILGEMRPTAEFPPLFPSVLAVIDRLGGDAVETQRLLMTMVGTATVVLIGLLGRRVGGNAVGLVAAGVAAVYPMLFLSEAILYAETLAVPLVVVVLILAYRAADSPTPTWFALLGLAIGLSALTRAEGLLLVVLLTIPLGLAVRSADARRRLVLIGASVAATAVLVVPWTIRNAVQLDAFVPVSNNVGTAIDGANCDLTYSGKHFGLWRFTDGPRDRPQAVACFEGFAIENDDFEEAAVAAEHRGDGIRYARDHVDRLPVVLTVRTLRTWGLYDPAGQIDFEALEGRPRRWQAIGTWMYWALLPLAVAGTVLLVRRKQRVWPLLSTAVLVSITTMLTYGQQRFRAAAEPAIVVLAAVAVVAIVGAVRSRRAAATP